MTEWRNRIVGHGVKPASQFMANPKNWRTHPQNQRDALHGALNEVGWVAPVVENVRSGNLVDGHERVWQALRNGDADVPYIEVDLSEAEEAYVLATLDPIGALADTDAGLLADLLKDVQSGEPGIQAMLEDLADKSGALDVLTAEAAGEQEPDTEPELSRYDVPDAIWPTDNDWGVPVLDANLQATALVAPFQAWGAGGSRKRRMAGTYHFYTEDYRYEALWADPSPVVNSGCAAAVEPNYSINAQMPAAVALWRIYQKRWMARWWQSRGLPVIVDMGVAETHAGLSLLGVPSGWRAYATRGYTETLDGAVTKHARACERAGTDSILFVVYGGGKDVRTCSLERGWLWIAEQRDAAKGKWDG